MPVSECSDADGHIKELESRLDANPFEQDALTELHALCIKYKRYGIAIKRFETVLRAYPQIPDLHAIVASLYEAQGAYEKAITYRAHALKIQPRQEDSFYIHYIRSLHQAGKLDEAIRIAQFGLTFHPSSQFMLEHAALAFFVAHRLEEALATFQQLARLHPSNKRAPAMIGILRMMMTDMREGLENYASHPEVADLANYLSQYYPAWKGESFRGKKFLLYGEQGVGDTIMFAGLLPWLLSHQPQHITLLADIKLVTLLARSFPGIECISTLQIKKDLSPEKQPYDFHVSMSVLLSKAIASYKPADHPAYLKPDPATVALLRSHYANLAKVRGKTRCIGISWHTRNEQVGFLRSIALEMWQPLFSLPGILFVSLQYGDHLEQTQAIERQFPGTLYCNPDMNAWDDIDDLGAHICALDEIITIDNFIVHLAGGLNVPTTLLLPRTADWRWGLTLKECLWYKSVTFERQETMLQWKPVMQKLRLRLENGISG